MGTYFWAIFELLTGVADGWVRVVLVAALSSSGLESLVKVPLRFRCTTASGGETCCVLSDILL